MILEMLVSVFYGTAAMAQFLTGQERACINPRWKVAMMKNIPVGEGGHIKNSSVVVANHA